MRLFQQLANFHCDRAVGAQIIHTLLFWTQQKSNNWLKRWMTHKSKRLKIQSQKAAQVKKNRTRKQQTKLDLSWLVLTHLDSCWLVLTWKDGFLSKWATTTTTTKAKHKRLRFAEALSLKNSELLIHLLHFHLHVNYC